MQRFEECKLYGRLEQPNSSAMEAVFAVPELLEHILSYLLDQLVRLTDVEDPRSVRTRSNAYVLKHLLRMTEVGRNWKDCIYGSNRLLRALFLSPDHSTKRSWQHSASHIQSRLRGSYYTAPSLYAPQLNPVIQSTFAAYEFRFWRLDPEKTAGMHCASLIIKKRDVPAVSLRNLTGQGKSISNMLLSQPPCDGLHAMIYDERDETRDYTDATVALTDDVITNENGVTLGMVHELVSRMFKKHPDVSAIKLITM